MSVLLRDILRIQRSVADLIFLSSFQASLTPFCHGKHYLQDILRHRLWPVHYCWGRFAFLHGRRCGDHQRHSEWRAPWLRCEWPNGCPALSLNTMGLCGHEGLSSYFLWSPPTLRSNSVPDARMPLSWMCLSQYHKGGACWPGPSGRQGWGLQAPQA